MYYINVSCTQFMFLLVPSKRYLDGLAVRTVCLLSQMLIFTRAKFFLPGLSYIHVPSKRALAVRTVYIMGHDKELTGLMIRNSLG